MLEARDLGRLKTWTQAVAAGLGGLAAAGAFDDSIAEWALGVALALTWISGLDYFRLAPRLLRGAPARAAAERRLGSGLGVLEQPGKPPDASVGLGARVAVRVDRGQESSALFGGSAPGVISISTA